MHASKYFNSFIVHLKCIIHYNLERMFGAPRIHRKPILTPVSEPLCPGLFDLYRMFFPWEKTMKMPTKPISRGYLERGHTDSIAFCSPLGSLNEWPCLEVCGLKAKLLLSSIQLLMGLCCRSFSLFRKRWIFMWNLWWTFKTILKKICWANLNTNVCWILALGPLVCNLCSSATQSRSQTQEPFVIFHIEIHSAIENNIEKHPK